MSTVDFAPPPVALRDYQLHAVDRVFAEFDDGRKSTLLVLPTGTGKTVVFGSIARKYIEERGSRVLVLAHRGELLTQAANQLARLGVEAAIEKADEHARASLWGTPKCVVASVQTMQRQRLQTWPRDHFDLIVTDEAHHAPAGSYESIYKHFHTAKHLGVTATADRLDGENLGTVFESLAYEYTLREAIQKGYLSRLKVVRCETSVNLADIRTTAGDLNQGDIEEAITPHIEELVNATRQEIGKRRSIVFTPDVGSADAFASALNCVGIKAESISGKSKDRDEILAGFRHGRFQVLVNCSLLTEGFDAPFVSAIVLARPTKSRSLYCLDAETEVLTKRGWVGPDDIRDDDIAAAFDLDTEKVRWSPILDRVDRPLTEDEEMMGIVSPSLDIRVSDRHRMVIRRIVGRAKRRTGWEFIEACDLVDVPANYEIPVSAIEDVPGLPLNPHEIEFLGWFLTDGGINRVNNAITIYQDEASPYHDRIKSCLEGCGFKYGVHVETRSTEFSESSTIVRYTVSKGQPRGRDNHLEGWARLEPYIDKSFSPALDGLSYYQLSALISAMNCGDGLKRKTIDWTPQTTSICTGNKTMADRLQGLCVRRGFRCNISTGHWNASPIYILHIKAETTRYVGGCNVWDRPHFTNRGWVEGERVWCISVETGAIITRRSGKVVIMGNSQMVGRGTRLNHGKEDCLVVDFAWLTGKHKLVSPVELFDQTAGSDEIQEIAKDLIDSGNFTDPMDAIERAEEVQQERQKIRVKAREREARYRRVAYDPIAVFDVLGTPIRRESEVSMTVKASPAQVLTLQKFGIQDAEVMSKRRASMMLDTLITRAKAGLATHKQVAHLITQGYEPDDARNLTIKQASAALESIFGKRKGA